MDAMTSLDESAIELRALLASRLAMAIQWSEREATMQELMETARGCLARTSDPNVRLYVLFAEWFCGWNSRTMDERHALAEEIQAIADMTHNREMSLVGMVLRMLGMLERGEMSSFDNTLFAFDSLAHMLRQPQSLWYLSMYKGMRSLVDGRLDDAAAYQSEFASIAARVNDANAFHSLAAQASLLQWERGSLENVLDTLVEGAQRYPAIRGFRAGLAWALVKVGRHRDAAREFEVLAANSFRDLPQRYDWSATVFFAAEVCAAIGDQRRARVLYQLLEPYHDRALVLGLGVVHLGAGDRLLGILAATLGQAERAEWHFEHALTKTEGGMPAWNGHTKIDYARFQVRYRRTGHQRAAQLAREARELARSLDMKTLEHEANAILEQRELRSLS
jgi:tetratricopeptide (TPR) repeat protein